MLFKESRKNDYKERSKSMFLENPLDEHDNVGLVADFAQEQQKNVNYFYNLNKKKEFVFWFV